MFKCLFVVKNLILFTYTPQSHSPQIYTHCEAAGFRWSPAASFVLCLLIRRATSQHNIQALLDVLPSTCTVFVEVIFEGDAAGPGLDFTAASP